MGKHIKPCIICGSKYTYHIIQHVVDVLDDVYQQHAIFCESCTTTFSHEHHEDSEEETIKWFNRLPRKEK